MKDALARERDTASLTFSILNGSIINEGRAQIRRGQPPVFFQYPQRIDNQ